MNHTLQHTQKRPRVRQGQRRWITLSLATLPWLATVSLPAQATPAQALATYSGQAAAPANAGRGQLFFTSKHGQEWSCASCHGALPTKAGQHAATGKAIGPLAPAYNPERFADAAKTEKWFKRNCNDVVGRACTAQEKADVLAWLISLKP
jgi:mono/diheme cytochrome c family protein